MRLHAQVGPLLAELERAVEKGVTDGKPRGRLRVSAPTLLTNAERQARYRARYAAIRSAASVISHPTRSIDRRSRPKRWREAVSELQILQAEYAGWLAGLPESLQDSPTAQALEAIVELDLDSLAEIDPPRGYGRD